MKTEDEQERSLMQAIASADRELRRLEREDLAVRIAEKIQQILGG